MAGEKDSRGCDAANYDNDSGGSRTGPVTTAIIIVNWNSGELLGRCLRSVYAQVRVPNRLIVVDNASDDGSVERAAKHLRDAHLIRLPSNVGFARANNVAASVATDCEGLALLNPDAVPEPGWLDALVRAAERQPDVAAFASQMRQAANPTLLDGAGDSYHPCGLAWRNGHGVRWTEWSCAEVEVFAACAAAGFYRHDAFDEVGGFDERYFCYLEDVDLGFRLRLAGYRCLYVPSAVVYHWGSSTTGPRSNFAVYHTERNVVWTFVKNMPGRLLWRYLPHHVALNLAATVYYLARGQGRVALRAKRDALRELGWVLRARASIQRDRRVPPDAPHRAMSSLASHPRYHPAREFTHSARPG